MENVTTSTSRAHPCSTICQQRVHALVRHVQRQHEYAAPEHSKGNAAQYEFVACSHSALSQSAVPVRMADSRQVYLQLENN
jgi:hypothetical protein